VSYKSLLPKFTEFFKSSVFKGLNIPQGSHIVREIYEWAGGIEDGKWAMVNQAAMQLGLGGGVAFIDKQEAQAVMEVISGSENAYGDASFDPSQLELVAGGGSVAGASATVSGSGGGTMQRPASRSVDRDPAEASAAASNADDPRAAASTTPAADRLGAERAAKQAYCLIS